MKCHGDVTYPKTKLNCGIKEMIRIEYYGYEIL